jgi:hypothetical protein
MHAEENGQNLAGEKPEAAYAFFNPEPADDRGIFLHGLCHRLAVALHRLTGKPLQAAFAVDMETGEPALVHAWVLWEDGVLLDAAGVEDIGTRLDLEFSDEAGDCWIEDVDEKGLMLVGEGSQDKPTVEKVVKSAMPLAQRLLAENAPSPSP